MSTAVGLSQVLAEVVTEVRRIETESLEKNWYPQEWVAVNGPRAENVQQIMVVMWTSWHTLVTLVRNLNTRKDKNGSTNEAVRKALVDIAAAACKGAVDVSRMPVKTEDVVKAQIILTSSTPTDI